MMKAPAVRSSSSMRNLTIGIAAIAGIYLAREILIPLAFAVILALMLAPAVTRLAKIGVGRVAGSLIMVGIFVVGIGAIGFVIFNQLVQVLNELPLYQDNIHSRIEAMRAPTKGALGQATENMKELGKELSTAQTPTVPPPERGRAAKKPADPAKPTQVQVVTEPAGEIQYLKDISKPFVTPLATTGMVLIFTVFLLIEQDDLRNRLFRLAGVHRLGLMTQALEDATKRVGRYLMLQFLVNAVFGALCGIGLYLIGVPYAALWGAVAALLRIVPYIGSIIAALLPLLLSLAVFDTWKPPVFVFLLFAILELGTANFVEPWLYGIHTGISSLALLVTTVFWTTLWGPAGLILSTPLTVCLVVLGRHLPQFSFLHILLGDEPVLTSEAQLYQRLLAMDDQGARLLMDQHLDKTSVLEIYDSIMIPALTMVEKDRHKGTLDSDREEFVFVNMREMLSDFADRAQKTESAEDAEKDVPVRKGRIFCIPASHESDEIVSTMLIQMLPSAGCTAIPLPSHGALQHVGREGSPTEADIFCISALPPFAFARARIVTSRLKRQFPSTKVLVGVWGFSGDISRAMRRFHPSRPDKIVTSLASAIEWMTQGDLPRAPVEPEAESLASPVR